MINIILGLFLLAVSAYFGLFALRVFFSDKRLFERNKNILRGYNSSKYGNKTNVCREFLIVDKRNKQWKPYTSLTDEACDEILINGDRRL